MIQKRKCPELFTKVCTGGDAKEAQNAYNQETYEKAGKALQSVKKELRTVNESAVRRLEEGLEETLTLHRL